MEQQIGYFVVTCIDCACFFNFYRGVRSGKVGNSLDDECSEHV